MAEDGVVEDCMILDSSADGVGHCFNCFGEVGGGVRTYVLKFFEFFDDGADVAEFNGHKRVRRD